MTTPPKTANDDPMAWFDRSPDLAIRCENLGVRYHLISAEHTLKAQWLDRARRRREDRAFWGLREMTLDIPRGQVVGLVGRNGSGKSTFLRLLARTLEPTEGRLFIRGPVVSILDLSAGMEPKLTGRENLRRLARFYGVREAGLPAIERTALAFADIGEWVDRPISTYSSGMRLRIAFSFMTSLPFEVMIVDEALGVGDQAFMRACVQRMWDYAHNGSTMIIASHNHAVLRWMCSLTIWLDQNRMRHFGPTDWVLTNYECTMGGEAPHAGAGKPRAEDKPSEGRP